MNEDWVSSKLFSFAISFPQQRQRVSSERERFRPKTKVNDIDIFYEIQGSGPNLLFISVTGGDLRNKEKGNRVFYRRE